MAQKCYVESLKTQKRNRDNYYPYPGRKEIYIEIFLDGKPKKNQLVTYKKRRFRDEKWKVMKVKIDMLIEANFKRGAEYHTWLANVIMVKKGNGFIDSYSCYNKIHMHPLNEKKTTFTIKGRNYCYRVMPFNLKNASAIYQ
ncbi:hypothetical protein CR513_63123, partial [Mucuna pruriens]